MLLRMPLENRNLAAEPLLHAKILRRCLSRAMRRHDEPFGQESIDKPRHDFLVRRENGRRYKGGNANVLGALVGMVMKKTKGQANPKLVTDLLKKKLS